MSLAIDSNDPEKVHRALIGYSATDIRDWSRTWIENGTRLEFNSPKRKCKDKALAEIAKQGLAPELPETMVEAGCGETLAALVNRGTEEEISALVDKMWARLEQEGRLSRDRMDEMTMPVMPMLETLKERCERETVGCGPLERLRVKTNEFDDVMNAMEDQAKKDHGSGADLAAEFCAALTEQREAQAEIVEEREIGRVSGAVNVSRLREAGATVVATRKEMERLRAEFKARTKRTLRAKEWCTE